MKKIVFYLSTGSTLSDHEEIFEYPDEVTEEEIFEDFVTWRENHIDAAWWEVEE